MNTPSPWLTRNLADERWFGDGPPNWKHLPSVEKAQIERKRRIRLLRKHDHPELVTVLAACEPGRRCLSGCCPECGRALQRFVATKASQLLAPYKEYDVVSIIGRTQRLAGNLHTLRPDKFSDHILRTLRRGRAGLALGGIDFSFNEFLEANRPSRWVPHFWLLIHNANRPRWERVLRDTYPARQFVRPRPIKIKTWNGSIRALGYALKTKFDRRISKITYRFARGRARECKNTTTDRLRASERVELFAYLHEIGLENRLVLFDVIKTRGGFDVVP